MKHILDKDFEDLRLNLPQDLPERVLEKIKKVRPNPQQRYSGLQKVGNYWSLSVGGYRALARKEGGNFLWFWVGRHDEYERRRIRAKR
jgi:hypothetical protein